MVPMTLNIKWITAALFAVLLAPILDNMAVTHVPIFWPKIIYTAAFHGTRPDAANVCNIPTDADELWIIAVTPAPANTPNNGFLPSNKNASTKNGLFR